MVGIKDVPDPIQWHEGMLLSPQHFQQESLRNHMLAVTHAALAAPFHWGVVHLVLDRVALVSGMVRVLELEAVMPDGLVVSHDSSSPYPLELDISPLADPLAQVPLTVHLTVPSARAGSFGGTRRWHSVEGRPVIDENGGDELMIPRLLPRLALVATAAAGEQPPQRLISMPLARVQFSGDSFLLADFAPPAMMVTANSTLGRLAADVARRLREKAMLLVQRLGGADDSGAGAIDVRSIVAGLPALEAMLSVEVCHPFVVYQALCTLVGHVSVFAGGGLPPRLSRYDHNDPLPAYNEIADYVLKMIDRVRDVAAPIRFIFEDGMFGVEMNAAWMTPRLIIGVRGPAAMSTAEVVSWVENAVIGSRSTIERLASLRVKGCSRQVIESAAEIGVSPQRGVTLFAIEKNPDLVLVNERLEIWNPDNLGSRYRPTDITLFVLGS